MLKRPRFKAKYHIENVPGVGIFLLSENEKHVLEGVGMQYIAPLINGRHSWPEIILKVQPQVNEAQAQAVINVLLDNGHVVEQDDLMPPQFEAFWNELGRNSQQTQALLADTNIHIRSVGEVDAEPFVQALQGFGFQLRGNKAPSLIVVLTDDYQTPALAQINEYCLVYGLPWFLAKPAGLRQMTGPLFIPGRSACWQCLETRLKHNREVETYIQRKTGHMQPFPVTRSRIPMVEQKIAANLTLQLVKWLALGSNPELESRIVTSDVFSLQVSSHYVLRRPQCPCCGNPALGDVGGKPLGFVSQLAIDTSENGSRLESPEATFARYAHHISEISGIVKGVFPAELANKGPLHVYIAGHNFALKNDELFFLKDGLRSNSSGKGRTDSQARTSALCEALERYSGLYRNEEAKIISSYRQLGTRAVDPRSVLHFSERQYQDRMQWLQRGSRFQVVPMAFDDDAQIHWSPVWSWTYKQAKYLPTSFLYYGFKDDDTQFYCWGDSNGNAAGSSVEDAALQGFLEVVERDAVAIWWYNRLARPAVDLSTLGDPYFSELADYFSAYGRQFWILDLTNDLGIPVYAAVNCRMNHSVQDIVMGFGAHLNPRIAINRAVTEMNQFISAVLAQDTEGNTRYAFDDQDTLHWWKNATLENQPYLLPGPNSVAIGRTNGNTADPDIKVQLEHCFSIVDKLGMEVLILNQTRPDVGLPVVKVIVPGLRHFWARFAPGRLYQVPVKMGWLAEEKTEDDLNPIPMFV